MISPPHKPGPEAAAPEASALASASVSRNAASSDTGVVELNWDEVTLDVAPRETFIVQPSSSAAPHVASHEPAAPAPRLEPMPVAFVPEPAPSPVQHTADVAPAGEVEVPPTPAVRVPFEQAVEPSPAAFYSATMSQAPESEANFPTTEAHAPLFASSTVLEVPGAEAAAAAVTPEELTQLATDAPIPARASKPNSLSPKRFLFVAAAIIVLAVVSAGILAVVMQRQQRAAEQERLRQLAAAEADSAVSRIVQQQRLLIQQGQQLDASRNFADALQKAEAALKLNGPLEQDAQNLRDRIVTDASNAAAQAAFQREDQLWSQALNDFQQDRLDQAVDEFQQVVAMDTVNHKAEAETYLNRRIPQARKDDQLFTQAKALAQSAGDERELLQARRDLGAVVRGQGPHAADAARLEGVVSSKLAMMRNQSRLHQLIGEFDSTDTRSPAQLRRLQAQFRALEGVDGPVANEARDYAENRIPSEMHATELPAVAPTAGHAPVAVKTSVPAPAPAPPRRFLWVVSLDSVPAAQAWQGSLNSGQAVGQAFVDGGVKIENHPLPLELVEQATQKNGEFHLKLSIDPQGRVSGGSILSGDTSLGQALLQAAEKTWQFAPPRVHNIPVATTATVAVYF